MSQRQVRVHSRLSTTSFSDDGVCGAVRAQLGGEQGTILTVSGWLLGATAPIERVLIGDGESSVAIAVRQPSPDIATAYPHLPWANRCRFSTRLRISDDPNPTALTVIPERGSLAVATIELDFAGNGGAGLADAGMTAVFIVGSPRSGTTILGSALRRVLRLEGFGEAHVAPLFQSLADVVAAYYEHPSNAEAGRTPNVMLERLPKAEMLRRLAALMRQIYGDLHAQPAFIDKTPGVPMIRALPFVSRAFPEARFIYARRRALENIESRRRKFRNTPFAEHCQSWADAMTAWQRVRPMLPAASYIEVDQFEIVRSPERVGDRIARLLTLDAEQTRQLVCVFAEQAPERTDVSGWRALRYEALDWRAEERAAFERIAKPVMLEAGYTLDEAYFADARAGGG